MTTVIYAGTAKYLSEIDELKNGLPTGVFNKKSPDCGGSYLCMNCEVNYILITPSKGLVDSLSADKNNKYEIFGVRGGINKSDIENYLITNKDNIKKFAVTWDSMYKIVEVLEELGESLNSYKLVFDEYHRIISNYGFRNDAINRMMKLTKKFSHYTFMSATPITSKYEFKFLKELPHYEVEWNNIRKVTPIRFRSNNPFLSVINLIKKVKSGLYLYSFTGDKERVDEVCIFLNSVEGIKTILQSAKLSPDEVKIICGDNVRNKIILEGFEVGKVTDSNKRFTFITSTGYDGINLFSNNCLNVVVSDGNKKHTFVNVDRDILQISGRQRTNTEYKNIWRDRIWHIYSYNRNPDSYEEREEEINQLEKEAIDAISGVDKLEGSERDAVISIIRKAEEDTFIVVEDGEPIYSDIKEMYLREQNEIQNYIYINGVNLREAYKESGYTVRSQNYLIDEGTLLMCTKVGFKELYEVFLTGKYLEKFKLEYPEFETIKANMTEAECNSLKWNKEKILKAAQDKQELSKVFYSIYKKVGKDFISSGDLRTLLKEEFNNRGIKLTAKGTLIEDCNLFTVNKVQKRVNGKKKEGYEFGKMLIEIKK